MNAECSASDHNLILSARFWLSQVAAWIVIGLIVKLPPYGWPSPPGMGGTGPVLATVYGSALGLVFSSLLGVFYSVLPERFLRGWSAVLAIVAACLVAALCWSALSSSAPPSMPTRMRLPPSPPGPIPALLARPDGLAPPHMPAGPSGHTRFFVLRTLNQVLVLGSWSAVFLLILLSRRVQSARERSAIAAAAAQQAQLQVLRAQLNPHFLFNALNSVVALVDEDGERAKEMIRTTANLLRRAIRAGADEWMPLAGELEFVDLYLRCEKIRFEERLEVRIQVDEATRECLIPAMLLHPLVENAVKHGMRGEGRLQLTVTGERRGDYVHLEIAHPGRLISDTALPGTGTGLKSVRARLEALLPGRHSFELRESRGIVCACLDYLPPRNEGLS